MKKNCNCKKSCGCGDNVVTQGIPCQIGYPYCDYPEKCSETFSSDCVIYTGDTISNLDIQKGMRLSDVVQKLINVIVNPACNYPNSPCLSVVGFQSTKITNTTINLTWGLITGGPTYQVEYRLSSAVIWTQNPITSNNSDVIGNLLPNSTYLVRVSTICSSSPGTPSDSENSICYSLTLEIKTKS